jgi:hypothetical protein
MLFPDQVVPFLQHDNPIVRQHALHYFNDSFDFGPVTADHLWAVIDRFGENEQTLSFATALKDLPQTDASVRRLLDALAGNAPENFEFHYQHAARDVDLPVLIRNRELLLGCPALLPHVRDHLELRLELVNQPAASAWDRLMENGRELKGFSAMSFNTSDTDALVEAAARGGADICARAMRMMNKPEANEDWREIFAIRVLGTARYEPAVDALVNKLSIDADVLREESNRALVRIGTPQVIEKVLAFYPHQPWDLRLYASSSAENIKRVESEAALLSMLQVELAFETDPDYDDESEPLVDEILQGISGLCSLAGLEESRRLIEEDPQDGEMLELCKGLLATATMCGVALPDESRWRTAVKAYEARMEAEVRRFETDPLMRTLRDNWREMGFSFPAAPRTQEDDDQPESYSPELFSEAEFDDPPISHAPIRNASPKIGRNDPCPCGSGQKYKKCCLH